MHGAIPGHGSGHGGGEIPAGLPAELVVSLSSGGAGASLVRGVGVCEIAPGTAPMQECLLHELGYAAVGFKAGAEIEGTSVWVAQPRGHGELLSQQQVAP